MVPFSVDKTGRLPDRTLFRQMFGHPDQNLEIHQQLGNVFSIYRDFGRLQRERFLRIGWIDHAAFAASKQRIARNFDIQFDRTSRRGRKLEIRLIVLAGHSFQRAAILGPYQRFVIRIPSKLYRSIAPVGRDFDHRFEPMRRPTRSDREA